jgi:hypothetical protein
MNFEAAPSAAGYLYQARLALLLCMSYVNRESSIEVSVERLDDVVFEKDGSPVELLQAKHHILRTASLTDYSPDLWKTIRVWASKIIEDPSIPARMRLTLVTTGTAPVGSAASLLRPAASYSGYDKRDPKAAAERLTAVASESKNKALQPAFDSYLALDARMRASLLSAVEVLDGQATVDQLQSLLEDSLRIFAPKGKAGKALELLEGWWWSQICRVIVKSPTEPIPIAQIETKLDEVRELLKRDALGFDFADAHPTAEVAQAYDDLTFVGQLRSVRVSANRIHWAKRDYYRAFSQRSKWAREHALYDGEIARFEARLIEEWEPQFDEMCQRHASAPAGCESLCTGGRELYYWAETSARIPLRTLVDRSLCVGSYHILANDNRVGWHRDHAVLFAKRR